METEKRIIGKVERLFAVILSKVKTVAVNIYGFLSLRRIVPCLIVMMMCVPCLMNVEKSNSGLKVQAIDYSEPVQTITKEARAAFTGNIVNDWREYQWIREAPTNAIEGSATISAYAVDYYGTNFEVWCSIYATGGGQSDSKIFDYGWSTQSMNDMTFPITAVAGRSIKVIFRYRYADNVNPNPPSSGMSGAMRFWITWEEPVNYSSPQTTALPNSWTVDTTATQTTIATFTTSTEYFSKSQFDSFTETVQYDIATLFGMFDSGEGLIRVCNYLDSHLPYVYAISAFCGLMGIATVLLDW